MLLYGVVGRPPARHGPRVDLYWAIGVCVAVMAAVAYGISISRGRDAVAEDVFEALEAEPGAAARETGAQGLVFEDGLEIWQDLYRGAQQKQLNGKLPLGMSVPFFYIGTAANVNRERMDLSRPLTARSRLANVPLTDESMGRTFYLFSKQPQMLSAVLGPQAKKDLAALTQDFDLWIEKRNLVFVASAVASPGDERRVRRIMTAVRSIKESLKPRPKPEPVVAAPMVVAPVVVEPESPKVEATLTRLPGEPTDTIH